MRMMVEILTAAFANSNNVPPIDPVRMLLANHSRVLASNTDRNGTPLMVKIAIVAIDEPTTGNQPAGFLANAAPRPTSQRQERPQ
jgi:hypothetical protein